MGQRRASGDREPRIRGRDRRRAHDPGAHVVLATSHLRALRGGPLHGVAHRDHSLVSPTAAAPALRRQHRRRAHTPHSGAGGAGCGELDPPRRGLRGCRLWRRRRRHDPDPARAAGRGGPTSRLHGRAARRPRRGDDLPAAGRGGAAQGARTAGRGGPRVGPRRDRVAAGADRSVGARRAGAGRIAGHRAAAAHALGEPPGRGL